MAGCCNHNDVLLQFLKCTILDTGKRCGFINNDMVVQ